MRKLIGFVFFVISGVIIAAIVIGNFDIISDAFSNIDTEDLPSAIVILSGILWQFLYQPIVVLLLSVIAMGKYSKG